MNKSTLKIALDIDNITYTKLIEIIDQSIDEDRLLLITYFNTHSFNQSYHSNSNQNLFRKFDIIHPDGFGVFLASKFLYGNNALPNLITGSTLYQKLLDEGIKQDWSFFFLGDTDETLKKIPLVHRKLKVSGYNNGFDFKNDQIINKINDSKTDILIVGMGTPKQEEWIIGNKDKLHVKVIIAVGDGIKVFAGTKIRGPEVVQKLGLEWLVRLIFEPKRLWKRYLIRNPLFIIRIFKYKFSKSVY
jgi:N-acetylglucosaminyldiphosphoundecaprenol N-acetyl-beta-D-mannosaminyltransferase